MTTGAIAGEPVRVRAVPPSAPLVGTARLDRLAPRTDPTLRIDDPAGRLRTGFGGSLVDLFPLGDSAFHLSAGGRLFGRNGRAPGAAPESLKLLPTGRGQGLGGRGGRRFAPALLMGYGRTMAQGLSLGVDTGIVMGRASPGGDRLMRLRGRDDGNRGLNPLGRVTMGYRF